MNTTINKFLIAASTALSEAVTLGFFHGDSAKIVSVVFAFLGAFGVYKVPNNSEDPAQ